jgi:hypothetical protein
MAGIDDGYQHDGSQASLIPRDTSLEISLLRFYDYKGHAAARQSTHGAVCAPENDNATAGDAVAFLDAQLGTAASSCCQLNSSTVGRSNCRSALLLGGLGRSLAWSTPPCHELDHPV